MWHLVYDDAAHAKASERARERLAEEPHARIRSMTLRSFGCGARVRGLKRADPKARPRRLEPGVTCRLRLEAKEGVGQIDFQTRLVAGR